MNDLAHVIVQLLGQGLVIVVLVVAVAVANGHEQRAVAGEHDAPALLAGEVFLRQHRDAAIDHGDVMHRAGRLIQHGMGQIGVAVAFAQGLEKGKIDHVAFGEAGRQHDIQQAQFLGRRQHGQAGQRL